MTPLVLWIVVLVIAYLIGSIPTGYLLVRVFRHEDIRASGSVFSAGCPTGYDLAAGAGLFAGVGHIFPVWLGFRGGKGVATALGVFLALTPLTALFSLIVFAIVIAITRYVSLGSITAAFFIVIFALLTDRKHRLAVDLVYIAIPLIVILKHHANIRRLLARTEPKFGVKTT